MPLFQKKPVVIEARQLTTENIDEIRDWINQRGIETKSYRIRSYSMPLVIQNPEGEHKGTIGDWIIEEWPGRFCPYKPEIFEMIYQPLIKKEDN
jgi:hypothetical protein